MAVALALALSLSLPLLVDGGPSGAWQLNPGLSETVALETVAPVLRPWLEPVRDLVIRLTDDEVVFYDADGLRRVYRLRQRTRDPELHNVATAARVDWDGVTLRIERSIGSGFHVIETYAVDPAERRLTVTIVVSVPGGDLVTRIRHVYDPVR